jgi:hypothetical protein
MNSATVPVVTAGIAKPLDADIAHMRLLAGVDATVSVAVVGLTESLAANVARVRFLAGVDAFVPLHTSSVITAVVAAQLTLEPASEFSFVVLVGVLKCASVKMKGGRAA